MGGRGSSSGGGTSGGYDTRSTGHDTAGLSRAVDKAVINNDQTRLRIYSENAERDIVTLRTNINVLRQGTAEDRAAIPVYQQTIRELEAVRDRADANRARR